MSGLTIESVLHKANELLSHTSTSPRLDAEILLIAILKINRSYLLAHPQNVISLEQHRIFNEAIKRREQGEPIAYILGHKEFWSMDLKVSHHTLIPRPETELIVELTLNLLANHVTPCVVDLGTGSGAIALALASERKDWHIDAVDISPEAIAIAKENASHLNLSRVNFYIGNWCEPLREKKYSAIVANPPYVAMDDPCWANPEMSYEPKIALVAERNGFTALEELVLQARNYLLTGGFLLLEHGWQQGEQLRDCFQAAGYRNIQTHVDLAGHDRVTIGQWIAPS